MESRWWRHDPSLRTAMLVAAAIRVVPMLLWIRKPCIRDECTYEELANAILAGDGMVGTQGWLWAPAYPYLMALHGAITGFPASVQVTQLFAALGTMWMLHELTDGLAGRRAARIAAWMYGLNPTMVFYACSQWSECLYAALLLGSVLAVRWARRDEGADDAVPRGWLPGALVGVCVLFRGVATYILPIFALALLVGRARAGRAWADVAAMGLAAALVVAPYSAYASRKFDGLVISDRTMGQMMWLGNNSFPPMTFDQGNGTLTPAQYDAAIAVGRDHCPTPKDPVRQDACETARGVAWIRANPQAFLARVPLRVAQLLNPHSFLTRHLRWGRWSGMPDQLDELLIALVPLFSLVTLAGGTIGFFARSRAAPWYAVVSGGIVLYHVAAIAVLAGLTRYRVPLEPLWSVYAAMLLAEPKDTVTRFLDGSRWSVLGAFVLVVLLGLMAWFLPTGWPSWGSW
jgi:hypothetical protein